MPGMLLLNGGDEFRPGNEPQDRELIAAARPGPAYVVATAAARQRPELAVATAQRWFSSLGLDIVELPIRSRSDAASEEVSALAAGAGLLYLAGGDPGLLASTLRDSRAWAAMAEAWRGGAALAGSSAGAMALCEWTPIVDRWPQHHERRLAPALGLVPRTIVLPHYERMGSRWSISGAPPELVRLGLDERTAAIWDEAGWRAAGAARVTVLDSQDEEARYEPGSPISGLPTPVS